MTTIFRSHTRLFAAALLLSAAGCAVDASAQAPAPPTKQIVIYNNSKDTTIYPMLWAARMSNPANPDAWLQGYFAVKNPSAQRFNTSKVYEAFFNREHGIAFGESLTITVPFFTQLKPPGAGGAGATADEYIDWWNAMRLVIFDSRTAVTAGHQYYDHQDGKAPVPVVSPLAGAALPSCAGCKDPVVIMEYDADPPSSIPFQLVEYTFGDYGGSPPRLQVRQKSPPYRNEYRVGYDVSSIDSVYLPVAIAPLNNDVYGYLGTDMTVGRFRAVLDRFIKDRQWPTFHPVYFPNGAPPAAFGPTPPPGSYPDGAYPGTVAVGPFNVFTETYRTGSDGARIILNPPKVSSNMPDGPIAPGATVSAMIDLWEHCPAPGSATCTAIADIKKALDAAGCPNPRYSPGMIPATQLDLVYGWVNSGCAGDFRPGIPTTPAQKATFEHYLKLQYNYCGDVASPGPGCPPAGVPQQSIFNPWTQLIHETLKSNAYAFSVDDAVGYVQLDGDGLIVTVGGADHLPCPHQLTPGPLQPNGTRAPPQPTCPSR
jgi:hypothetical protein